MLSGEAGREDMPMCEDANGGAEREQRLRISSAGTQDADLCDEEAD
jgi:hypothetical protein